MYELCPDPNRRLAATPAEPEVISSVEWVRRNLGFEPDAHQAKVLSPGIRRGLLNCSRQWGKSTIAAAKALHLADTVDESLIVVVSPTERQSGELVAKVETFARRMGISPKGDGVNDISLTFRNGSRVVGLPGSEATIRGFSAVSLVLVDEAARVKDGIYAAALMAEMSEMRLDSRVRSPADESVWRESAREDLVFATALSSWGAGKAHPEDVRGTPQYARGWF